MILRSLSNAYQRTSEIYGAQPAWAVFIESQKRVTAPYGVIFQAEHSKLAGNLAEALLDDAFGDLPPEVIQAVGEHDFGWDLSDRAQMEALGQTNLRPFPSLSAEETLPSWRGSIAHAQSVGPLVDVLVSRHFCMLGGGDPNRADFVRTETERRATLEPDLPHELASLDRWTGAVGFCDLLSLYLCCGSHQMVEFPVAHPADPAAAHARKITLSWYSGSPQFSSLVLKSGTQVSLTVRTYSGQGKSLTPLTLEWRFANS